MAMLKTQDILVMLKLVALGPQSWSYAGLGFSLGLSPSQVHGSVRRALAAELALRQGPMIVAHAGHLEEFMVHALKYVMPPVRGNVARGMPTCHAAPPLARHFPSPKEPPPVWPDPDGPVKGLTFAPLCKQAPRAARQDAKLYQLLVLSDALRGGRPREQALAVRKLAKRLARYQDMS